MWERREGSHVQGIYHFLWHASAGIPGIEDRDRNRDILQVGTSVGRHILIERLRYDAPIRSNRSFHRFLGRLAPAFDQSLHLLRLCCGIAFAPNIMPA
jgi:hypothetical protein